MTFLFSTVREKSGLVSFSSFLIFLLQAVMFTLAKSLAKGCVIFTKLFGPCLPCFLCTHGHFIILYCFFFYLVNGNFLVRSRRSNDSGNSLLVINRGASRRCPRTK